MENRVKFRIGEIEFEAEGSADIVERERSVFLNAILPAAVEAIVRTRGVDKATQYIEAIEQPSLLLPAENTIVSNNDAAKSSPFFDLSRTSLASYISGYGKLSEQDFVLLAAYYYEKKNSTSSFSSDTVKQYYEDARRTKSSNTSDILLKLAQKGLIMDDPNAEKKSPKQYILTSSGIGYVDTYQPKDEAAEKQKAAKPRRPKSKALSTYSSLSADDLNLQNYSTVRSLKDFKEKMMMVLYIVFNEGKGEWFKVSDVSCILTDIFGESSTEGQIKGVFTREKLWFKTENVEGSKKEKKHKILNGGIEFARKLLTRIEQGT